MRRGLQGMSGADLPDTPRNGKSIQETAEAASLIFSRVAGEFLGPLPGRELLCLVFFRCFHLCSLSEINSILKEKLFVIFVNIYPLSVIQFTHKE